jgi:hypothetical protein
VLPQGKNDAGQEQDLGVATLRASFRLSRTNTISPLNDRNQAYLQALLLWLWYERMQEKKYDSVWRLPQPLEAIMAAIFQLELLSSVFPSLQINVPTGTGTLLYP